MSPVKLRTGTIETRVYKAPTLFIGLQNAVRAYDMVTRDIVRTKNRLKAVFRARGIATDKTVYDAERRAGWLKKLPSHHRRLAEWIGHELDALRPLHERAENWMNEEAKVANAKADGSVSEAFERARSWRARS